MSEVVDYREGQHDAGAPDGPVPAVDLDSPPEASLQSEGTSGGSEDDPAMADWMITAPDDAGEDPEGVSQSANPSTSSNAETGGSTKLDARSARTIEAIEASYLEEAVSKGQFASTTEAEEAIRHKEAEVREKHALTINMSADSVRRLGVQGRVETFWDHAEEVGVDDIAGTSTANGKAIHDDYVDFRRTADDALHTYAPDDATGQEPVFAAVAGPDELIKGAAPEYGNWHAVLDDSLADRAVYNFSDSHTSVTKVDDGFEFDDSTVLNHEDALKAKAIAGLYGDYTNSLGYGRMGSFLINADPDRLMTIHGTQPGYVEAAILDEVPLDKITTIHGNLNTPEDVADASGILSNPGVLEDKLRVDCGAAVDPLTKSWVEHRFEGEVPRSAEDDPTTQAAWEEIGLTPEATYDEVADALDRQLGELWPKVARAVHGFQARRFPLPSYRNPAQWHNYVVEANRWLDRPAIKPPVKEDIQKLLRLQQAGVFFRTQTAGSES